MKKLLPKSTQIGDIISHGFSSIFGKLLFLLVPFLLLGILFGLLPVNFQGSFDVFWGLPFGMELDWFSVGLACIALLLTSFVTTFVILAFLNYSDGKNLSFSDLFEKTLKRFWGPTIFTVIQSLLIGLPFFIAMYLVSYNQVFAMILFVVLLLIGLFLLGQLLLVNYLFLDKDLELFDAFKESFAFTKKIGRGVVVGKSFVIMGIIILLTWGVMMVFGIFETLVLGILNDFSNLLGVHYFFVTLMQFIVTAFGIAMFSSLYIAYREKFANKDDKAESLGCLFYGCWIAMGIVMLNVITFFAVFWFLGNWAINNLTTDKNIPVVTEEFSVSEQAESMINFESFENAISNVLSGSYVFSEHDINAVLQSLTGEDGSYILKDHLKVTIEEDILYTQFSIPMDFLPYDRVNEKYINGKLGWVLKTQPEMFDKIYFTIDTGTINNKTIGQEFWSGFNGQNLLQNIYERSTSFGDKENYEWIQQIESVKLIDGNIYVELVAK